MLNQFHSLPAGLLDVHPGELLRLLGGPTLIHLPGATDPPLFVSTLLHGDETTGFYAVQQLLRDWDRREALPRAMTLFLGNPAAAASNVRRLPNQLDFNRIWAGGNGPEHGMADEVMAILRQRGIFAAIDLHNNTGRNPHYGCVSNLDARSLGLARLFSSRIVYSPDPHQVITTACAPLCPSITVEAGVVNDTDRISHTREFLEQCLRLRRVPPAELDTADVQVYHSVARVLVPPELAIEFSHTEDGADLRFPPDLELLNFTEMPPHALLGWRQRESARLIVLSEDGRDVSGEFLEYKGSEIRMRQPVVPSMFTIREAAVRDDCLGYLMQRYGL